VSPLGRDAAAARRILERRARDRPGEFVTAIEFLDAGVREPSRVIAHLIRRGVSIEAHNPHPGSSFQRWRLVPEPQLQLDGAVQLDAEQLGDGR
jgi:hypothetical protein